MRITYIENVRLPTGWAHGYQIMRTCEALAAAGASLTLVVPKRRPEGPEPDPFLAYGVARSFDVRRLPCLDLVTFRKSPLDPLGFWLSRASFLRRVVRERVLDGADWGYTRDPATAAALLRAFPNIRLCVELHDDPRSNARRWASLRDRISAWVVIGAGLKALLLAEGVPETRICVAPDGFSPEEFAHLPSRAEARRALRVPETSTLIVYTGQLLPWKGIDGIAPAFARLPAGVELAIVGGTDEDRARVRAAAGGPTPQVRFIPHLPRAEAHAWLAAADAALLPTSARFAIGKLYTSPVKLFEYLAAGLPVIAADVPTSHEVLDETTAAFFAPDDPTSFLDVVRRLAALDPSRRRDMAAAAKEKSAAYTWNARGARIARFLESNHGSR